MTKSFLTTLLAFLACSLVLVGGCATPGKATMLFSPDDAKSLQLNDQEWEAAGMASKALTLNVGPRIEVEIPELVETDSGPVVALAPVATIVVRFEQNKAPVDMASLDVTARKGWFSKNLTDKLSPYIEGTTINAEGLKIPEGKFKLEIHIKDAEGRETEMTYRFEVSD